MSGFEELGLMSELVQAVDAMEWYLPRPIQQEAIPLILGGGHVMCAAETGSGKTGAFCLPILQVTWEGIHRKGKSGGTDAAATIRRRCAINSEDCNANAKVSMDGLQLRCHDARNWSGARCTFGIAQGKYYYEALVVESGGIVRVGYSALKGGLELGKDAFGFGYGGTGKKSYGGAFDDYGGPFDAGDRIGCAIDLDSTSSTTGLIGTVTFFKNGTCLGEAFKVPRDLAGVTLHPAVCIKNSQVKLCFGEGMKHLPTGYARLDDAAGPEQDKVAAAFVKCLRERATGKSGKNYSLY